MNQCGKPTPEIAAGAKCLHRGSRLIIQAVIYDVARPFRADVFGITVKRGQKAAALGKLLKFLAKRGGRRRIERHPAALREIDFNPRMGVALAHGEKMAEFVPTPLREAVGDSGGNAENPQQHRHAGSVIFAMPGVADKQEIFERRRVRRTLHIKAVAVILPQIGAHRDGKIIRIGQVSGDAPRQRLDARRKRRKLQIRGADVVGIVAGIRPQRLRRGLRHVGKRRILGRLREDNHSGIVAELVKFDAQKPPFHAVQAICAEQHMIIRRHQADALLNQGVLIPPEPAQDGARAIPPNHRHRLALEFVRFPAHAVVMVIRDAFPIQPLGKLRRVVNAGEFDVHNRRVIQADRAERIQRHFFGKTGDFRRVPPRVAEKRPFAHARQNQEHNHAQDAGEQRDDERAAQKFRGNQRVDRRSFETVIVLPRKRGRRVRKRIRLDFSLQMAGDERPRAGRDEQQAGERKQCAEGHD